jgi:hypothetical protein
MEFYDTATIAHIFFSALARTHRHHETLTQKLRAWRILLDLGTEDGKDKERQMHTCSKYI